MNGELKIGSIDNVYDNLKVRDVEEVDPISVTSIEQVNNKTITVILNQNFTETEKFQVYETNNIAQIVNVTAVQDSINPEDNKRVLVAEHRFNSEVNYTLKITKDTEVVTEEFTVSKKTISLLDAKVDVIGDRILNVKFQVPIQNLDSINEGKKLANFYDGFYGQDIFKIIKEDHEQKLCWFGCIDTSKDNTDKDTTVRVSGDYKSMEIQFNNSSIPNGNHKLMINFSKEVNESFLKDFSDDEIQVPIMAKDIVVSKETEIAEPISVTAIDRTTLIVKFNKPVLKKDNEKNVINVNGVSLTVESVDRVGVEFDTLQYNINELAPLPVGKAIVIVGRITDANGYITPTTIFKDVPIVPISPTIVNVEQYDDTQTKVVAIFSKAMKDEEESGGVKNKSYYTITKLDGTPARINEAIEYFEDEFKVILLTEKLEPGTHTLLVRDIEDSFGLSMKPQSVEFNVVDATVPKVESITFIENTMIIKFDEKMKTVGEHSITEIKNYLINNEVFPPETTAVPMNEDKWVKINLPETSVVDIPKFEVKSNIYIGYSKLKEIKYIENESGNIYPLSDVKYIQEKINKLDIAKGSVTIVSENKLQYKYLDKNEFCTINIQDFEITVGNEQENITPLTAVLKNEKIIEFTFSDNTFNGGISKVFIKTKNTDMKSEDIYGYKLLKGKTTNGDVTNGIKSKVIGISLIKNNTIRITFDKSITHFDLNDFRFVLDDSKIIEMTKSQVVNGTENKVFEVNANIPPLMYTNKIEIVLAVPENLIRTLDKDGMKIAVFDTVKVKTDIAESVKWKTVGGCMTLANNEVTIEFSEEINPGSLIPNKNFDGVSNNPWNGEDIDIPANKVIFTSGQSMHLAYNDQFGKILLENKKLAGEANNTDIVKLKLIDGKKVILKFSSNERIAIKKFFLVTYEPYIDSMNNTIKDKKNIFYLNSEYKPTAIPTDM